MDQPGTIANPARGQLNREKICLPCPRPRLRNWSRETGSGVPTHASPLILHTWAESRLTGIPPHSATTYIYLYRQPRTGQSGVYQVTQLRTDGVHCREVTGAGPLVLNVVPVKDVTFSGFTLDQLSCASPLFFHPPHYRCVVVMTYYLVE